jgi:hypothetical protein
VESYKFSSNRIKLGYAFVHDSELGTNDFGAWLAIWGEQRKHVAEKKIPLRLKLGVDMWTVHTLALSLYLPTYVQLSNRPEEQYRPMSVILHVVLGVAFSASGGM